MSGTVVDLSKLSVAECLQLVEDLWDRIAAEAPDAIELTPAQQAEIEHRLREHDADPDSAIPWEQVRAELFRRGG